MRQRANMYAGVQTQNQMLWSTVTLPEGGTLTNQGQSLINSLWWFLENSTDAMSKSATTETL